MYARRYNYRELFGGYRPMLYEAAVNIENFTEKPSRLSWDATLGRAIHTTRKRRDCFKSQSRFSFLIEHDLFRKPVPTFRDHALNAAFDVRAQFRN
jgi:hypothetical protein